MDQCTLSSRPSKPQVAFSSPQISLTTQTHGQNISYTMASAKQGPVFDTCRSLSFDSCRALSFDTGRGSSFLLDLSFNTHRGRSFSAVSLRSEFSKHP